MKNFNNVNLTEVEKAMVCDYTVSKDDPNAFLYSDGKYYDFEDLLEAIPFSIPEDYYEEDAEPVDFDNYSFQDMNVHTLYDICFHPENYITNEKYRYYDWYFNVEDAADLWNLDEDEPNYEQIKAERIAEAEKQLPELIEELKNDARQTLINWMDGFYNWQLTTYNILEEPDNGCPFETAQEEYVMPYDGLGLQFYFNYIANIGLSQEIQELAEKIGFDKIVSNWKLNTSISDLDKMEEQYKEEYDYDEEYA